MIAHPNRSKHARKFFILCERPTTISAWHLVAGSYALADVDAYRHTRLDHGAKARNLVIKRCTDAPRDISGVVEKLNTVRSGD